MDDELWAPGLDSMFESRGNNPRAWFAVVETLTEAANKVGHDVPDSGDLMPAINAVYAMLLGYAIECALKGLWLQGGQKLVSGGNFQKVPDAGNHQLRKLALAVNNVFPLDLNEEELETIDRLSGFVLFAGRYPIPLRAEGMKPKNVAGQVQVPHYFSATDFSVTRRVLNRLTTALNPYLPTRAAPRADDKG